MNPIAMLTALLTIAPSPTSAQTEGETPAFQVLPHVVEGGTALPASSKLLATHTIFQYGGPESKTECARTQNVLGAVLCVEYRTVFQQHAYDMAMYGPADMDPGQANQIKDACLASAVAGAIAGAVLNPASVWGIGVAARAGAEVTLRACIETTAALGQLVSTDFRLEVHQRNFW